MLILPESSCSRCQAITGAFEGDNAGRLFRPIRRQFRFLSKSRGRKYKEARAKEQFVVVVNGVKRYVSSDEYPGLLISFAFPFPTALLGLPPKGDSFAGSISLGTLPDFDARLNAIRAKYGTNVTFPTHGSAESVGRLLAKIAHAYAVADVGIDGFRPYLLGIIRNHDSYLLTHLVGSAIGTPPLEDDLHSIEILSPDIFETGKLIVVSIHLFSNYHGMAVHYVVAGERL